MGIRSLVVGIDGSETSYRAFAMAVALAVREQGCVHACFVSHPPVAAVRVRQPAASRIATSRSTEKRLASSTSE
jgi:hypothetical protein